MRSHKFINSLLLLMIRLVAKESRANENNCGIKCSFVLFIDKRHISQVIHFKDSITLSHYCSKLIFTGTKFMINNGNSSRSHYYLFQCIKGTDYF